MARVNCPVCQGSGWKTVERSEGDAPRSGGVQSSRGTSAAPVVWAVRCECTAGDEGDRLLARARVPERYRHCDFANFETDNELEQVTRSQIDAWNRSLSGSKVIVERFAREFPVGAEHGLLLMGPCGVGKTHLAVAALKEIVSHGHSGVFYDYCELLKQIQDSFNPQNQATEMSVLEPVLKSDFLVLDDLGSSKPSLWALETVGHILNTRYNEKRVTLLTTNFLDGEGSPASPVTPRASGLRGPATEDSLTDRIGKRIRSRLYEMCRTVEIYAADYRKEIRHAGPFRP